MPYTPRGQILETGERLCMTCRAVKPLTDFYRDASKATGHQTSCKLCQKANSSAKYLANPQGMTENARIAYLARRDQAIARMREYDATHPRDRQKDADAARRRRALLRNADVRIIAPKDWNRLVARYRGLCAYCQAAPWTQKDHIIPLTRGGRHSIGNLLPVCFPCNRNKATKLLVEWRHP